MSYAWNDKRRAVPVDEFFAQQLVAVKQRLGLLDGRLQQRRRRRDEQDEQPILHVRRSDGTRVYFNAGVPEK